MIPGVPPVPGIPGTGDRPHYNHIKWTRGMDQGVQTPGIVPPAPTMGGTIVRPTPGVTAPVRSPVAPPVPGRARAPVPTSSIVPPAPTGTIAPQPQMPQAPTPVSTSPVPPPTPTPGTPPPAAPTPSGEIVPQTPAPPVAPDAGSAWLMNRFPGKSMPEIYQYLQAYPNSMAAQMYGRQAQLNGWDTFGLGVAGPSGSTLEHTGLHFPTTPSASVVPPGPPTPPAAGAPPPATAQPNPALDWIQAHMPAWAQAQHQTPAQMLAFIQQNPNSPLAQGYAASQGTGGYVPGTNPNTNDYA